MVTLNNILCFNFLLQLPQEEQTFASCALAAILDQAAEQLGYYWRYANEDVLRGQLTTQGRQYCIEFTDSNNHNIVGYIFGRPNNRSYLARESAIVRALTFIDSSGYIIYDVNYHTWTQWYRIIHGPIAPPDDGSDSD